MTSSRTPEGDRERCPVCGHPVRLEPSWPARDGPCPCCGHLLWFAPPGPSAPSNAQSAVLDLLVGRFGPLSPEVYTAIDDLGERAGWDQRLERAVAIPSLTDLLAGQ